MAKYRKKPVVIEAVQWTGTNIDEVLDFGNSGPSPLWGDDFAIADQYVVIATLEGKMTATPGDWIIMGVKGEFYPCKPDIFAKLYDPA